MDVVMHDIYQISLQNSPIGGQGLLFLKKKEQNVHVYIILLFFFVMLCCSTIKRTIHKLLFLL